MRVQEHVTRGRRGWEALPECSIKIMVLRCKPCPGGLLVGRGRSRVFGGAPSAARLQYARRSFGDKQ